jgi:hypothetical protein
MEDLVTVLVKRMDRLNERLLRIDLGQLSDESAIAFAQAQAAVAQVELAIEAARYRVAGQEFVQGFLGGRLNSLVYPLECDYRRKYGKFPEGETWHD